MARPKKIQHFRIRQFRNASGTDSWQVTGTKPGGVRVRKNYAHRDEAIQAMADCESECAGGAKVPMAKRTRLSAEELAEAEAAMAALPQGRLSQVVRHYLSLESRAHAKGVGLDAAIAFVEAHYREEIRQISVLNAYEQFIAAKSGITDKTETHYRSSLKLLLLPDPNKKLHSFNVGDIEGILAGYDNTNSNRTYRKAFSAFFNWAVRHHYCLENPCERLDKLPADMSQIASLSLDEVRRLLAAALTYQGGSAASAVAIGIFAGLRPSELRDLKKHNILNDKIRVEGGKLRRQLKRSVPIPPVLAEWLTEFPFDGLPPGWDAKMKLFKKVTQASRWVQDIIRHTSITFQAERDKNEPLTAFNCGTSIAMMNRHYRHTIDDESIVAEFWSLTPANLRADMPVVALPSNVQVTWPPKAQLKKLVWSKPMIHAARDVGVSDVALRRHCVKEGIELPARGHWARLAASGQPAAKKQAPPRRPR